MSIAEADWKAGDRGHGFLVENQCVISDRRGRSLRSVKNRLQWIHDKLGVHGGTGGDDDRGRNNLRGRAVSVAILRRLLNLPTPQRAEADLRDWLDRQLDRPCRG